MNPHHEINFDSLVMRDLKATYVFTCYTTWQFNGRRELIFIKKTLSYSDDFLFLYFSEKDMSNVHGHIISLL